MTRQTRHPGQPEAIGNEIEIVAHLDLRVVGRVVRSVAAPVAQRRAGQHRQILGVDMIGIDVVLIPQRGGCPLQAFNGQAIGSIDSGDAQDADDDATPTQRAQLVLGIEPSASPGSARLRSTGLVNTGACAVTVDTAGTDVDDSLW